MGSAAENPVESAIAERSYKRKAQLGTWMERAGYGSAGAALLIDIFLSGGTVTVATLTLTKLLEIIVAAGIGISGSFLRRRSNRKARESGEKWFKGMTDLIGDQRKGGNSV